MSDRTHTDTTPIVVLVHGAFVDASSWNGVIAELKAAGLDARWRSSTGTTNLSSLGREVGRNWGSNPSPRL
jgi:hypothetical protein